MRSKPHFFCRNYVKERKFMTQHDIIQTIPKDSNYHLDLFDKSEIQDLRQKVEGNKKPFIYCPIRRKPIQLKPEEVVRQLYAARLLNRYHYPQERVRFEHLVNFGREKKRADIVILDRDRPDTPYIIVEVKKAETSGWQVAAPFLLQRYWRTYRCLDKWAAYLKLSPQEPELL